MARTVGVRFQQAGKIFYYDAAELELEVGNYVVVETSHGVAVGRVVITPEQVIADEVSAGEDIKPITRLATEDDVEAFTRAQERAKEDLKRAREKAAEQGLNISIASGEYDLEGSQFTAYFTASERVDFRSLVRELSREFDARVQLLQVGDRDRAKLVDGFDVCGQRLCCSSWMTNFPAVSIRMAKEQDLPLNPQKISGVCGRLYCCLTFEYEDYRALRGTLPKVGSTVSTPSGDAKVTGIDFNREVVKLFLLESRTQAEVAAVDFQLQHGVTIRPVELVREIEGPLRRAPGEPERSPAPPPGGRRSDVPAGGPRPAKNAQPDAPTEAAAGEGAKRNRRRRRRRRGPGGEGRGGGGGSQPGAN